MSDARQYRDGQLAPQRIRQWNYYKGLVDAQPRRNRSRAVSMEVRDTVEAVHAQLMRMIGATGNIVSFEAQTPNAQRQAEVATAYIHHLFLRENRGWTIISDFLRDALIADAGILYHRAECVDEVEEEEYQGLTPDEADALAAQDDVTVVERHDESEAEPGPEPGGDADDQAPANPNLPAGPQIGAPGGPSQLGDVSGGAGRPGAPFQPPPGPSPLAQAAGPPGGLPGSPGGMSPAGPPPGGSQGLAGQPPAGIPHGPLAAMAPVPPPSPAPPPAMPSIYLRLSRRVEKTAIRVTAFPPDEFLLDPAAVTPQDAKLMAMDTTRSVGEVTAMGFRLRDVLDYAGTDKSLTAERMARIPYTLRQRDTTITDDPTTYPITLIQANVRIDQDGDGVPEIWRVTAIGEEYHIIAKERTDVWEFTVGSPYNVPHAVIGTGVARLVTDLQDVQTAILRNQLDSLYQAITPKFAAVENQVNLDDATDESFGRVVRVRQPGAYAPLTIPFVGEQAFPMIERLDKIREFRTGVSPEAAGLDADALQSSTEIGVRAVIGQAQLRIETIARNFVENAITDLFRALLKLAVRYQDRVVTFTTAQGFLTVDPRGLDPDMQVVPVVGLGPTSEQAKMMALAQIKQTQEMIYMQMGPSNPLVGIGEYRNTLNDILMLTPYRNTARYFKTLPPNVDAQMQQMAQARQGQNPQAQAAQAKIQATVAQTQAAIQGQQQKQQYETQRDAQKQQMDAWRMQQEMALERQKADAEMQLQNLRAQNDYRVDVAQMQNDAALERFKMMHQIATNAAVPNPNVKQ